jgi:tetratricopeptide (TPR) repeat protein
MYNPIIRIVLGAFGALLAWYFYSLNDIPNMLLCLVALALVIWGYFKNGTVYVAFRHLQKGNYQKAEHLLNKVKKPEILKKSQKSYYHFTKGFIELNKDSLKASKGEFLKVLELGLRTENDTSIVSINLALIEMKLGNFDEALLYINKTKELNYKPALKFEIERVEKEYLKLKQGNHEL